MPSALNSKERLAEITLGPGTLSGPGTAEAAPQMQDYDKSSQVRSKRRVALATGGVGAGGKDRAAPQRMSPSFPSSKGINLDIPADEIGKKAASKMSSRLAQLQQVHTAKHQDDPGKL